MAEAAKVRVVVSVQVDGEEVRRMRVPIGKTETVAALKAVIQARIGSSGGLLVIQELRGAADGAELFDEDLVEDALVDDEVLAAICATSTTTTTTPAAPLTFELRVKRVGGVAYATVPMELDGRTTAGELKMQNRDARAFARRHQRHPGGRYAAVGGGPAAWR
jgi:hypothetical protein